MRHYRYEEDKRFLPAYKKEVNEDGDVKVFFFKILSLGLIVLLAIQKNRIALYLRINKNLFVKRRNNV
jgi:hypothetical protein